MDSYNDQDHQFMLDQVHSRIGEAMRIRVDFVDEIPRLPSGKQLFAVSTVKPEQVLQG
jgi:hypothetical protein